MILSSLKWSPFSKGTYRYWFSGVCTFSLFKGTWIFLHVQRKRFQLFRGDSSFRRRRLWWPPILVRKNGWIQPDPSLASGSPQGNARHSHENWNLNYLWEITIFSGKHKGKMAKSWNVQMVFLFHHGGFHVDLFLRVYRSECDNRMW